MVLGSELCGVVLRGRAIIERAGFDFGSFCDFCFLYIYFFLLFFFYNNINRLENEKPNFTSICNFQISSATKGYMPY